MRQIRYEILFLWCCLACTYLIFFISLLAEINKHAPANESEVATNFTSLFGTINVSATQSAADHISVDRISSSAVFNDTKTTLNTSLQLENNTSITPDVSPQLEDEYYYDDYYQDPPTTVKTTTLVPTIIYYQNGKRLILTRADFDFPYQQMMPKAPGVKDHTWK